MDNALSTLNITLFETIDSANIGSVARSCLNFGVEHLRLVNTAEHDSNRAYALACNAGEVLDNANTFDSLNNAISDRTFVVGFTRRVGHQRPAKKWRDLSKIVNDRLNKKENVALLFGREDNGLSENETNLCHELSVIDTSSSCPSINLAQSVSIALYELTRNYVFQTVPEKNYSATDKEVKHILSRLEKLFLSLGYSEDDLRSNIMKRCKDISGRAGLEVADIGMINGLLNCKKDK